MSSFSLKRSKKKAVLRVTLSFSQKRGFPFLMFMRKKTALGIQRKCGEANTGRIFFSSFPIVLEVSYFIFSPSWFSLSSGKCQGMFALALTLRSAVAPSEALGWDVWASQGAVTHAWHRLFFGLLAHGPSVWLSCSAKMLCFEAYGRTTAGATWGGKKRRYSISCFARWIVTV